MRAKPTAAEVIGAFVVGLVFFTASVALNSVIIWLGLNFIGHLDINFYAIVGFGYLATVYGSSGGSKIERS